MWKLWRREQSPGYAGNRTTIPRLSIQWLSHCTDYVSPFPCNVRRLSCNRQPSARSAHQLRYCGKSLATYRAADSLLMKPFSEIATLIAWRGELMLQNTGLHSAAVNILRIRNFDLCVIFEDNNRQNWGMICDRKKRKAWKRKLKGRVVNYTEYDTIVLWIHLEQLDWENVS